MPLFLESWLSLIQDFNIPNRGINFIPRLDSVPESTIKTNLGINYVLNLTHLVRTLNSLIGGKSLSKYTKWRTYCFTNMQKKVPTARNWPLPTVLTDEELRSRMVWQRVNQITSRNPKRRSPKADERKPCAVANFFVSYNYSF